MASSISCRCSWIREAGDTVIVNPGKLQKNPTVQQDHRSTHSYWRYDFRDQNPLHIWGMARKTGGFMFIVIREDLAFHTSAEGRLTSKLDERVFSRATAGIGPA